MSSEEVPSPMKGTKNKHQQPKKTKRKVNKEYYVYYQMLAGAGAGAITKTSIAPLERIKILFQIQGMKKDGIGKNRQYKNVFQASSKIMKEEGFFAFYKGNGANVLRVIPVYALKFAFNDSFKATIARPGQSIKTWTSLKEWPPGQPPGSAKPALRTH